MHLFNNYRGDQQERGVSAFTEGVSIEGFGRSRCWASTCELVDAGGAAAGRHMGAISKAGHVRAPRSSRGLMLAGCECGRDRVAARRTHGFRRNDCRLECAALQEACFTAVSNGHGKANRKAGIPLLTSLQSCPLFQQMYEQANRNATVMRPEEPCKSDTGTSAASPIKASTTSMSPEHVVNEKMSGKVQSRYTKSGCLRQVSSLRRFADAVDK